MQIGYSYSEIVKVAFPIIVASFVHTIIGITDIIFLGHLGDIELGAGSLGMFFFFVIYIIGVGLGTGLQIIIGRRSGEKNHISIGLVHDNAQLLFFVYATFSFLICAFGSEYLFPLIIKDDSITQLALAYIKNRSWGIFFASSIILYRSFYTGIARTGVITYASLTMAFSNIILNYILIYGHGGFPGMGVKGAAIASSISEGVAAIILLFYTFFRKENYKYSLFKFSAIQKALQLDLIHLSSPVIIQNILSMGSWFIFFLLIEKMGSLELAISNVVRSAYMIIMTPIWGFSLASNSMVSNLIGQEKQKDVMILISRTAFLSLIITLGIIIIILPFGKEILGLITNNKQVVQSGIPILYVIGLASVFFSVGNVLILSVSGTGATITALRIEIVCIICYLSYIFLCYYYQSGLTIFWCSELLYWITIGLFSYMYLRSGKWNSKRV